MWERFRQLDQKEKKNKFYKFFPTKASDVPE